MTIKATPQAPHGFVHKQVHAAYSVPVTGNYAQNLPTQVPLYVFTDNHQLVINQRALATLFLKEFQSQALSKVS